MNCRLTYAAALFFCKLTSRPRIADGKCTIELTRVNAGKKEHVPITGRNLRLHIARLLDACMRGPNRSHGGIVKILSKEPLPHVRSGYVDCSIIRRGKSRQHRGGILPLLFGRYMSGRTVSCTVELRGDTGGDEQDS